MQKQEPTAQYKLSKTIDFIHTLAGGGERSLSWTEIRSILDLMTESHMFIGGDIADGANFVRGRQIFSTAGFDDTDQLIARPPADITSYGRCHAPQQSVLYASTNLETVYSELALQFGDFVQTITIKKKDSAAIRYAVVGEVDHLRRHGKCSMSGKDIETKIRDHWASLSEIDKLRFNITDAFIADRFRSFAKYPHEYKTTSAFCDIVFAQGIDALVYPSVGHLGGWNIAIKREAFVSNFEVGSSEIHEIYDCPGYGFYGTITHKKSSAVIDKTIKWLPKTSSAIAFGSFDEYLRYQLCLTPRLRGLLILAQKNVEQEFTPEELSKMAASAPEAKGGSFSIIRASFEGTMLLTADLDFKKLTAELDKHSKEWDFITLGICDDISSQEKFDEGLAQMKTNISSGNQSYSSFTRDGRPLFPVYSTAVAPPEKST